MTDKPNAPFGLRCAHCRKESRTVLYSEVWGKKIVDITAILKFTYRDIENEAGHNFFVYCSEWCKWRHGKTVAWYHRALNHIGK
jgi:hypothetical protein